MSGQAAEEYSTLEQCVNPDTTFALPANVLLHRLKSTFLISTILCGNRNCTYELQPLPTTDQCALIIVDL